MFFVIALAASINEPTFSLAELLGIGCGSGRLLSRVNAVVV